MTSIAVPIQVTNTNRSSPPVCIPIPKLRPNLLQPPEEPSIPADFQGFDHSWTPHPDAVSGEMTPFCVLYPGTKDAILALPTFPKRLRSLPGLSWPFYIKDIPGMGKAMVASAPIEAGQLVLNERPLIVYPHTFPHYTHPSLKPEERDFMQLAATVLFPPSKKLFFSLHNAQGAESMTNVQGIFHTNALGIGQLPGPYKGDHCAVCHFSSRMNHR
jgi:hypothetical protein